MMSARSLGWVVGFAIALALAPSAASAQGGLYVGFGLGPALQIDEDYNWPTQLRIEEEIGYYFDDRPEGFFIGFAPSQSFLRDFYVIIFAPRFGYMINLVRNRDITFQLGPAGTIPGIAIAGPTCSAPGCDAEVFFHFSFSFMMRLLVAQQRVAIYLRPVEFEFAFGDGLDSFRYILEGGFQFHI
jgi:hypothetical protein